MLQFALFRFWVRIWVMGFSWLGFELGFGSGFRLVRDCVRVCVGV